MCFQKEQGVDPIHSLTFVASSLPGTIDDIVIARIGIRHDAAEASGNVRSPTDLYDTQKSGQRFICLIELRGKFRRRFVRLAADALPVGLSTGSSGSVVAELPALGA